MLKYFEFKLALSYLQIRKASGLIALFSLIGTTLGVATLIIVMSVMNGFREEFTRYLTGVNGHINISDYNGLSKYEEILPLLKEIPSIKTAFPIIEKQSLLLHKDFSQGVLVKGLTYKDFLQGPITSTSLVTGEFNESTEGIIIGLRMAENLGLGIGDKITLLSPETFSTIAGPIPRVKAYKIAAIFSMGMVEYDSNLIYMPLKMAQEFFNLKNKVTAIDIFLYNFKDVEKTITELTKIINLPVYSWEKQQSSFFTALEIEKNVMFLILVLIILVAAFNIISSLIMLVQDKKKDIAILITLGATSNNILKIFTLCGSLIGVLGTILGSIIGVLISANLATIQLWLQTKLNLNLFDPLIYFLNNIPSVILPSDVIKVVLLSIVLTFLATIIPARKASKIDPILILKES